MTTPEPDEHARQLAAESLSVADPIGWFDRLYSAADAGTAVVPWDRGEPNPVFADWMRTREASGSRRQRALVVGCGYGSDAELLAACGFDTVAFDVSPHAVETARRRHPDSAVRYVTADLLDLPSMWRSAFDLVVEVFTVQSLPESLRPRVIAELAGTVAPGGTLLVVASTREDGDPVEGPPWPLTRSEIDSFAASTLSQVLVEDLRPQARLWRAQFDRPRPDGADGVLLETERMTLRRFTGDDADNLFALHNDPEVMHFLNGGRAAPMEHIREKTLPTMMSYAERYDSLGLWAAIEKATGRFLGWFELTPADEALAGAAPPAAELGYRLHRFAWGRGLATEGGRALVHAAFTSLGLDRVVADTMAVNAGSRRVLEKSGLALERTFHTPWDGPDPIEGHEHGEVLYALNRHDWLAGLEVPDVVPSSCHKAPGSGV